MGDMSLDEYRVHYRVLLRPIVYEEWCKENKTDPLMHDPFSAEFDVLVEKRLDAMMIGLSDG